jgi:hypothetical protein
MCGQRLKRHLLQICFSDFPALIYRIFIVDAYILALLEEISDIFLKKVIHYADVTNRVFLAS